MDLIVTDQKVKMGLEAGHFNSGKDTSTDTCEQHEKANAFCTFAVTGAFTSFQPIYICRECLDDASGEESPLCVCQACADHCHGGDDHDVEFVGMGPCYCDCNHLGTCQILSESRIEAEKLIGEQADSYCCSEPLPVSKDDDTGNSPFQEVFEVPQLLSEAFSSLLVQQAQELIQHTKETFWLDAKIMNSVRDVCTLESLAWNIYQRHRDHYQQICQPDHRGGAEWWVQIKDPKSTTGINSAIDLHYDKDEALAEVFGLGSFPTISTVTYLTASAADVFNPTLVLDHTYVQGEGDMIDTMLVSKPVLGKHLVFDGRLLHGAPAHPDLKSTMLVDQSPPTGSANDDHTALSPECSIRVTFLVNIWKQRPAKVQQLPEDIRVLLLKKASTSSAPIFGKDALTMNKKNISVFSLNALGDLPEKLQHRIVLPFVSKGATWEDQFVSRTVDSERSKYEDAEEDEEIMEESDDEGLVVITFPPPPMTSEKNDTLLMKFGPGLQAYLDHPERCDELENKNGEIHCQYEAAYV